MTPYHHLTGYLHRWKLFSISKFMLRIHRILDIDRTPFLHSHPFYYVSIILKGGYTEQVLQKNGSLQEKTHRVGSIIFRRPQTRHRIKELPHGDCLTLFFSYKSGNWMLENHPDVKAEGYNDCPDGLYTDGKFFHHRLGGKWFIRNTSPQQAISENRLSIHQNLDPKKGLMKINKP